MILKPKSVIDYNAAKKGVDISDQMASYYDSRRKTLNWYKKLIFEIVTGTAVVNAWVLHHKTHTMKMRMLDFVEYIIRDLVAKDDELSIDEPDMRKRRYKHSLQERTGMTRNNRKRCQGCYENLKKSGMKAYDASNRATRVVTYCAECDDEPTLCLNCFNETHRNK